MKKIVFVFCVIGFFVLEIPAQTITGRDMINSFERPVPENAWGGDTVLSNGFRIFAIDVDGPPQMQRLWFVQFGRTVAYRCHITYDTARAAEQAATALVTGFAREYGEPSRFGGDLVWVTSDYNYQITLETELTEDFSIRILISHFP